MHLHATFACEACTIAADSSNLIPLTQGLTDDGKQSVEPSNDYTTRTKAEKEQDRRDKMKGLKEQLLKPKTSAAAAPSPITPRTGAKAVDKDDDATPSGASPFVDRAAARRSRNRDAGGSAKSQTTATPPFLNLGGSSSVMSAPASIIAPPSNPFASTSKGAVLLAKLGGASASTVPSASATPTSGLGKLIEPKTIGGGGIGGAVRGVQDRPGLGSRPLVAIDRGEAEVREAGAKRGWREDVREANRKRFREMEAT